MEHIKLFEEFLNEIKDTKVKDLVKTYAKVNFAKLKGMIPQQLKLVRKIAKGGEVYITDISGNKALCSESPMGAMMGTVEIPLDALITENINEYVVDTFLNETTTLGMFYNIAKYDDELTPEEVMKELKGSVLAIEHETKNKTVKAYIKKFIVAFREKDKETIKEISDKYKYKEK